MSKVIFHINGTFQYEWLLEPVETFSFDVYTHLNERTGGNIAWRGYDEKVAELLEINGCRGVLLTATLLTINVQYVGTVYRTCRMGKAGLWETANGLYF